MTEFKHVNPSDLQGNFCSMFGKDSALVTSRMDDKINTMTVAWGGIGHLFGRNVATIYVRKSRYTYDFIENSGEFSISFFDSNQKDNLIFCGRNSGRDVDKFNHCGYTIGYEENIPYIQQSNLSIICKTLYKQDMLEEHFQSDKDTIIDRFYPNKDFHRLYIGEILHVLEK